MSEEHTPATSDEERQYERERRKKDRIANRERLKTRLEEENADDLVARLEKCGKPIDLTCIGCGTERTAFSRCDLKWCPNCAPALATRTVQKYQSLVELAEWPLFVTFTTKNYEEPSIRPLRKAWGKLRRLRWFRRAAIGGVVAFECTNTGKGWHWHAHALIDCEWLAVTVAKPARNAPADLWRSRGKIAAKEVGEQWSLCTGRKSSVKVRRVWTRDDGDVTKACMEVLKYCVTAETLLGVEEPIAPYLRLLDGTRLVTSFGSFFGKGIKRKKLPPPMCKCGCSEIIPSHCIPRSFDRPTRSVTFR